MRDKAITEQRRFVYTNVGETDTFLRSGTFNSKNERREEKVVQLQTTNLFSNKTPRIKPSFVLRVHLRSVSRHFIIKKIFSGLISFRNLPVRL